MTAYEALLLCGAVLVAVAAVQGVRAVVEHGSVRTPAVAAALAAVVLHQADQVAPLGLSVMDLPRAAGAFIAEILRLVS